MYKRLYDIDRVSSLPELILEFENWGTTQTKTIMEKKSKERLNRSVQIQRTFEIVEGGTVRGRRKLIDSFGYTYNVKRRRGNGTDWQCTARPKHNPCRAAVSEKADGTFVEGSIPHNHSMTVGTQIVARIRCRIKKEAATDLFKPAPVIVREVLQEELTNAPCPSLPPPEQLARIVNRFREKLRPADYD